MVTSTNGKVASAIATILKADANKRRAESTLVAKAAQHLEMIALAARELGPTNSAQFDAVIRKPLRQAMKDSKRYAEKSLGVMLSYHCKAIIGLSNGIVAKEGESEQDYITRVLPELKARKFYIAANAGGNGAKKKEAKHGKVIKVSRDTALAALVGKDAADRQVVDYLVKNCMDKLRALYTSIVAADKVA